MTGALAEDLVSGSALGQSELSHQSDLIESAPALDNLVVFDPEYLDAFKGHHIAGGRYPACQVATVSAARGEALNDDVLLGHLRPGRDAVRIAPSVAQPARSASVG